MASSGGALLSLVVSITLAFGLLPAIPSKAHAEEAHAEEAHAEEARADGTHTEEASDQDGKSVDVSWYGDGSKSQFAIDSAAGLAGLAKLVNEGTSFKDKTIALAADIDLDGYAWIPIGTKDKPFQGTFDGSKSEGGSYAITNLAVEGAGYLGLFGATNGATVKNVALSKVRIEGSSDHLGAVAGKTSSTALSGISVDQANITGTMPRYSNAYVGGITGEGHTGSISGCTVNGLTLAAKGSFVGGISGQGYAKISDCTVKGSDISTEYWKVGGIIGQLNEGNFTIEGVEVVDTVVSSSGSSGSVGGIVGFSNSGKKAFKNSKVERVTVRSSSDAGGLVGTILSTTGDAFSFEGCVVSDTTFASNGSIAKSGGLVGTSYWRGSSGTTFTAKECTVKDVKADAPGNVAVGVLFGTFSRSNNAYSVDNVNVAVSDSEKAVTRLLGDASLGKSSFTIVGKDTKIDAAFASEAIEHLQEGTVIARNEDGSFGLGEGPGEGQPANVAFNKTTLAYHASLKDAFVTANPGEQVMVLGDDAGEEAVVDREIVLEPGSFELPRITVKEGAKLALSATGVLNAELANDGTVAIDREIAVKGYSGEGSLVTGVSGMRVVHEGTKLRLVKIPYAFEINGAKYEASEMGEVAKSMGASWNGDEKVLTLGEDVSVSGTIGILEPMGAMAIDLNGRRLDWPAKDNAGGAPLIVTEANTTLTVQDGSEGKTGLLRAEKGNALQGGADIVLKGGTVQADGGDAYYPRSYFSKLRIEGGSVNAGEGFGIVSASYASYLSVSGGSFNVLPSKSSLKSGFAAVKLGESYRVMPKESLEADIPHGANVVAASGGVCYSSVNAAMSASAAAGPSGGAVVVDVLDDSAVQTWKQVWDMRGITVNGNGHALKIDGIEGLPEHNAPFHSAGGNVFKDLTVDLSGIGEPSQGAGYRVFEAAGGDTFDNVTVVGNEFVEHGIFASGSEAKDETVTVAKCSFKGCGHGIGSEAGADGGASSLEKLAISGSKFESCDHAAVLHPERSEFTGNEVVSGKLDVMHGAQVVTGNSFAGASKVKFFAKPALFQKNKVSEATSLAVDERLGTPVDVSKNYWGGGKPSAVQLSDARAFTGGDVYYMREAMEPADLNAGSSSGGKPSGGGSSEDVPSGGNPGQDDPAADDPSTDDSAADDPAHEDSCPSKGFSDVDCKAWYHKAIDWAVANKVLKGIGGTDLMMPDAVVTRAQMAAILWNVEGNPQVAYDGRFSDVSEGDWFEGSVAWARSKGLFVGYEGTGLFGPGDVLTREQAAAVLMRWSELRGEDTSARADLSAFADSGFVSGWASECMSWAVAKGVVNGVEKEDGVRELQPSGTATRAQAAALMMNLLER